MVCICIEAYLDVCVLCTWVEFLERRHAVVLFFRKRRHNQAHVRWKLCREPSELKRACQVKGCCKQQFKPRKIEIEMETEVCTCLAPFSGES